MTCLSTILLELTDTRTPRDSVRLLSLIQIPILDPEGSLHTLISYISLCQCISLFVFITQNEPRVTLKWPLYDREVKIVTGVIIPDIISLTYLLIHVAGSLSAESRLFLVHPF